MVKYRPSPYNTRYRTRKVAMQPIVSDPKQPSVNDPAFIDLSDRIGGGSNAGAVGGDMNQVISNNQQLEPPKKTGTVPKPIVQPKLTLPLTAPPSNLAFPPPTRPNNSGASQPLMNNVRDPNNDITPVIKEMMAEAKNAIVKELIDALPELVRTVTDAGAGVEQSGSGNRFRNRNKRRRHNSSLDSVDSVRRGNDIVGQGNPTNSNLNMPMPHTAAYVSTRYDPPPVHQLPNVDATAYAAISTGHRVAPERQNRECGRSEINIEKWGLSFQGHRDAMSVEDFLFRLDYLRDQYGCSWGEVLRDFHRLLSGEAREWYWLYIRSHGKVDWPTLQFALRRQYSSQHTDFEILRELTERKQRAGESIDEYFHVVGTLRSRLRNPIAEYEVVRLVKGNLRESLARMVYPISVYSLTSLEPNARKSKDAFPAANVTRRTRICPWCNRSAR